VDAGSYYWVASFSGDSNNEPKSTVCGESGETSVVNKAKPTISTSAVSPVTVGANIHDTATIAGLVNPDGTGTITFNLYGPSESADCSGTAIFTDTVTGISADGDYPSGDYLTVDAGSYYWVASFSGDSNNEPKSTVCGESGETSVVNKRVTTLVTVPDPVNAALGTVLNDTAILSGGYNPTGKIIFRLYDPSDTTCSDTPVYMQEVTVTGNGSYDTSPGFASNKVGTWRWTAEYFGDPNNLTSSSGCDAELVTVTLPILVTDSNLCTFDTDTEIEDRQFRNILTQDVQQWPHFKFNATNPGQFFYNLSVNGDYEDEVSLTLDFPWPFVTQGANALHAWDFVNVYTNSDGDKCYCPGEVVGDECIPVEPLVACRFEITLDDYETAGVISPHGDPADRSGYELNGTWAAEQVLYPVEEFAPGCELTIPESGFLYINQHLDNGLKGLKVDIEALNDQTGDGPDRYSKHGDDDAVDPTTLGELEPSVLIPELADHTFCMEALVSKGIFEGVVEFADNDPDLDTITRTDGNWIDDGFGVGQTIYVYNGSNDGVYMIASINNSVITLTPEGILVDATESVTIIGKEVSGGCDTVQNDNEFKKNPGVAGRVTLGTTADGEAVELAYVQVIDPDGVPVGTCDGKVDNKGRPVDSECVGFDLTDSDGWWQIVYKHKGKPTLYTVEMSLPNDGTDWLSYSIAPEWICGLEPVEVFNITVEFADNDPDPDTITRTNGSSWYDDGFHEGQIIIVIGGTNDGEYTIASIGGDNNDVITLTAEAELTNATEDVTITGNEIVCSRSVQLKGNAFEEVDLEFLSP
jgi:hypothetical protein